VDRARDLQLSLARLGHADLVDRQRDHRGAEALHQRDDGVDALPAVLHVDGVHDPAAGDVLEGGLDDVGLGRVDDERRLDAHRQELHDLRHLLGFVGPLGERDADVQHMRARVDLIARDLENPLVVVGQKQPLHLA
jgi:hypothetical protein